MWWVTYSINTAKVFDGAKVEILAAASRDRPERSRWIQGIFRGHPTWREFNHPTWREFNASKGRGVYGFILD